jgi:hypothetical protein
MSTLSRVLPALVLSSLVACDKGPTRSESAAPGATASGAAAVTAVAKVVEPKDLKATPPGGGQSFGAGVKLSEVTPIAKILAAPADWKGKTVHVEGMVTDVCEMRGCWFEMAGEAPGEKLRFKVTDGDMVFPVDAKGKWAVAEGAVAVNELSLEQTRAYAEEQAKEKGEKFDPASVTAARAIIRIDGTGAVIRDKK